MLRISLQTLRANRGTLAGAFIAIWLAVTLAYGAGQLMAGALGAPGPGRFAAVDAVVQADPTIATATTSRWTSPRRRCSTPRSCGDSPAASATSPSRSARSTPAGRPVGADP